MPGRVLGLFIGVALLMTACDAPAGPPRATSTSVTSSSSPDSTTTSIDPGHETTTTTLPPGISPLPVPVVRHPAGDESIYFVMTDRFANADPGNDTGGSSSSDPLVHGFLPTAEGYYHGGDLKGLEAKLDYLQGLGVTAIWLTPPFVNNPVQGDGTIAGSSAGYHGYWQIDYTRVDPHLGTDDDMNSLVEAAHDRGMKVFFDIVANHTGDVITYDDKGHTYVSKTVASYRDAAGNEFDDAGLAGSEDFPELDPAVSFPKTPAFPSAADRSVKAPEWLNKPEYYHNRGDSTFVGESSLYGDFFGLDDLFTEHPDVVAGMTGIFTSMIDRYDIDGFRVDTVKHVNDEFWHAVIPQIRRHAEEAGKDEFFIFGEVFGEDPMVASRYTTSMPFPSLLDFGFNFAALQFAAEDVPSKVMEDHFRDDDWFLDADSNASMLVKFMGNHDIGRLGRAIKQANPDLDEAVVVRRMELAMEAMFFSRGIPVVYYGDEQGFVGDGGDKGARQDMFPSQVATYNDDDLIGTDASPADDNFNQDHPLYRKIGELAALRADNAAFVTGNHHSRWSEGAAGIYAFSRIDRDERVEFVVALNNALDAHTVTFAVASSAGTVFTPIYGPNTQPLTAGEMPDLTVTVPALSTVVYRADAPVPPADQHAPTARITSPSAGANVTFERFIIAATMDATSYCDRTCWPGLFAEVTFAIRVDGGDWEVIGTDDAPPFRVFWDSTAYPTGAHIEVIATVDDLTGQISVAVSEFTLGDR